MTTLRMVVRRLDGIEEVEGDADARTLSVRFDSTRASVDEIQSALRGVGYDASVLD